jgi:T5SS/PEP-CTERM-associated repeat protein
MTTRNSVPLMAAAFICAALSAQAATCRWISGGGSGEWQDPAKWSPASVPGISDTADFTHPQTTPFTVSFTADAASKLTLGTTDAAKPVAVTFDLNGHTLTHTNGTLDAQRALDWTVLDGTLRMHPTGDRLDIGYYQGDWVPKVTIGAGAVFVYEGTNSLRVGSRSAGELVIRDGGQMLTSGSEVAEALRVGLTSVAGYTNYTAKMTVTGEGSVWTNSAKAIVLSTHALATAELNVTDNGLFVHTGTTLLIANAAGANASLNIASGGVVDARPASSYMSIGNYGTGTVTVAGTGSALLVATNQYLILANTAGGSQGTLIIEEGGLVEKNVGSHYLHLGYRDNATGRMIVRDGGLLRWVGGFGAVAVGGQGAAGGSIGEMTVTGATSRAILGEFSIGQLRGNALVTVADGGTVEIYRAMYVGRISTNSVSSHNGIAKVVVTGAGSVVKKSALSSGDLPNASISATTSLGIGGCGFQGWGTDGLLYYRPMGRAAKARWWSRTAGSWS